MMESSGFYCMFSVSPATLASHKVVWRRMDRRMSAAAVSEVDDKFLGLRPCIPQETCVFVSCSSKEEALYLSAVLNSALVDFIAQSYNVRGGKGFGSPNLLQFVKLPRFEPKNAVHLELSELAFRCHDVVSGGETGTQRSLEAAIDELAASLWAVSGDALKTIQGVLERTRSGAQDGDEEDSEE